MILGMNFLEFNHVYINCFDKTVLFLKLKENLDSGFLSAGQVKWSLRENEQVLVLFTSLRMENNVAASDISVVCEFLDVFPNDICDLPHECEV